MTTREKFLKARDHIWAKEYDEARAILVTIDHPKANEWLDRIDQLSPRQPEIVPPSTRRTSNTRRGFILFGMVTIIVLIVIAGFIFIPQAVTVMGDMVASSAIRDDFPLADYFPDDTLVYWDIRIDDAHIQSWNNLMVHIQESLPEMVTGMLMMEEPLTLTEMLNMITETAALDGDFQTSVRSWLGDEAAFATFNFPVMYDQFLSTEQNVGFIGVIQITDRDKAKAFVEQILLLDPTQSYSQSASERFTIYQPSDAEQPVILIDDNVIMIATPYAVSVIENGITTTLKDNPKFIETMALLPESQYEATAYLNIGALFKAMLPLFEGLQNELASAAATMPNNTMFPANFASSGFEAFLPEGMTMDELIEAQGTMSSGYTFVDDLTIIVDTVQNVGDPDIILEAGPYIMNPTETDPAFLSHIPEDAALVMQSADINAYIQHYIEAEQFQQELIDKNSELYAGFPEEMLQLEQLQQAIAEIDDKLAPATGLTVQDDILSWMTGDYAFFINYEPALKSMLFGYYFPEEQLEQNFEFGLVIEVTDAAKARTLINSLGDVLSLFAEDVEFAVTYEDIADTSAAVISFAPQDLLRTPIDVVIGSNDDVFVIATREVATEILSGQGGFDASEAYAKVQPRLLSGSHSTTYVGQAGFDLMADSMIGLLNPMINRIFNDVSSQLSDTQTTNLEQHEEQMREQGRASLPMTIPMTRIVTALFESITVTSHTDDNFDTVSRFTLSFSE